LLLSSSYSLVKVRFSLNERGVTGKGRGKGKLVLTEWVKDARKG